MTTRRPFSNASEYMIWRDRNCDQCAKDCPMDENGFFDDPKCDIEDALSRGGDQADGAISVELLDRAGLTPDHWRKPPVRCHEFVPSETVTT